MKSYNIHNILKIKTNIEFFPAFLEVDKITSPDLEIINGKFTTIPSKFEYHRFPLISYGCDKKLFVKFKPKKELLKLLIEDLEGKTKFYFKESLLYRPFHNVIMPAWPSIKNLILFLLQVKFLQRGYVVIHSATLSKKGKGIILPAWPGTGKSTTCYNLMKNGFEILGDEISIFSEAGDIYRISDIGSFSLKNRKIPFNLNTKKKYEKLEKVIFLKKGSPKIEKMEPEDMINMIIASTNFEFQNFFTRYVFLSYCFLYNFEPDFVDKNMRKILKNVLNRMECYIIYGSRNNFHRTIGGLK